MTFKLAYTLLLQMITPHVVSVSVTFVNFGRKERNFSVARFVMQDLCKVGAWMDLYQQFMKEINLSNVTFAMQDLLKKGVWMDMKFRTQILNLSKLA